MRRSKINVVPFHINVCFLSTETIWQSENVRSHFCLDASGPKFNKLRLWHFGLSPCRLKVTGALQKGAAQ